MNNADIDVLKLVDSKINIKFALDPIFAERYGFENIPKPAEMSKFFPKENKRNLSLENNFGRNHARTCVPMMDAMNLGIGIPLWSDMRFDKGVSMDSFDGEEFGIESDVTLGQKGILGWSDPPSQSSSKFHRVIHHNHSQLEGMSLDRDKIKHGPVDTKTGQRNYIYPKLDSPWKIKTPPGWSVLLIPPINNFDLPIQPFSGVVDTDAGFGTFNLPCYVSDKTFTGIITKGTVVATIIPFPRVQRKINLQVQDEEDEKDKRKMRYVMESAHSNQYLKEYRDKRR
tara:strand:- start:5852 stop:6703 length:852 start_codon:yes stop_codon:yes gene_type:complete